MTDQAPEKLIIEHPDIDFGGRYLYRVALNDIESFDSCEDYKFKTINTVQNYFSATALWRGYICTYLLDAEGVLILVKVDFPFSNRKSVSEINEKIEGDFWLDLRYAFTGEVLFVPFNDGQIDPAWIGRHE